MAAEGLDDPTVQSTGPAELESLSQPVATTQAAPLATPLRDPARVASATSDSCQGCGLADADMNFTTS